jgi:YfiR/HmsC-like
LDVTETNSGGLRRSGRRTRTSRPRLSLPSFGVDVLVLLMLLAGGRPVLGQGSEASEYEVKAAFLYHFSQFVDWPEGTFKEANSPIVYCTIGEDPFHGALDASLSGKAVGERALQVQHFKQLEEIRGCQILFIGEGEQKRMASLATKLKGNPVLTVGESEHFIQEGGMIGFLLEENKIRFEINLDVAEHAKLKLSSRLLGLAKRVIGGRRGN